MKCCADLFSRSVVDILFMENISLSFRLMEDKWVIGCTRELHLPAYQTPGFTANKLDPKVLVHPLKCCRKHVLHILWGLHCLWMTEGRKAISLCVVLFIGGDMVNLIMFARCKGPPYTISCVTYTVQGNYSATWSFHCSTVIVWWTGMPVVT